MQRYQRLGVAESLCLLTFVREHNLSGKSHTALVNLIRNQGPDLVRAAQSNSLRGPKASGDTVETMAKMLGSKWSTSRSFPAGDAVYHCTRTDLTFLVQCMFTDPRFKGALRSSPPPLDYPIPSECATAPIFCQVAREAYAKDMLLQLVSIASCAITWSQVCLALQENYLV